MTTTVGKPLPRVDGRLKVTGQADYAAESAAPRLCHAVVISAPIGKGQVRAIDGGAAARLPGVLAIITHENAGKLAYRPHKGAIDPQSGERLHVLQDAEVRHWGQPVAVVVAETLEEAQHAAAAVRIHYDAETPRLPATALAVDAARAGQAVRPEGPPSLGDHTRGSFAPSFAAAAARVDAVYTITRQNHNPMEPHVTVARWDGDQLEVRDKNQWVSNARDELAAVFGIPVEKVRVHCPFVGGAFGASLRTWPHATLAAVAARHVGRPVKLALTRKQMFFGTGYRPATWQRVRLGAERDGRLVAVTHEGVGETSRYEQFVEALLGPARMLYSCANLTTSYRLLPGDVHTPTYMRAPGESSGMFALECAVDELAHELGVDPVELRLRNEPRRDEEHDLPFSSRSLVACMKTGAARFGWQRRSPKPGTLRDGNWRVGLGMAAATYPMFRNAAGARVRLVADGSAVIETAAADMGPGTYISLTQVAADALSLPTDRVRVKLGDSSFPRVPPHGGSQTMASVGSAVLAACEAVREAAAKLAVADPESPLHGADPRRVVLAGGTLALGSDARRKESLWVLLARRGLPEVAAAAGSQPGDERRRFSMHSFGAVFAEVGVDADLGIIRVRRMVGAYGAGRIVNPLMARSQAIGGMVGGIGMTLLEETHLDARDGRIVNASMADYLVPVNADIPVLEAVFVDERDPHVNPLGVKGLGEITLVGVAPAIANAIFNATGKRVRSLPILPETLL